MKLRVTVVSLLLLVAAGSSFAVWRSGASARACAALLTERQFPKAAEQCTRAFEGRPDGALAASAAMAWLGAGKPDEAWKWANLPEGKDEVRSQRVRGVVLKMRGQADAAREELERALSGALAKNVPDEAARAAHALAGLQWEQGRYSASWETLEISAREAKRAGDGPALALAELARGDVLRNLGDGRRADDYFQRALDASAPWPIDHAYALLKVGLSQRDRGAFGLAKVHFERSLALAEAAGNEGLAVALRINLADVLASAGDANGAELQLGKLDASVHGDWDVLLVKARVAMLRRDGEGALAILDQVERLEVDAEMRWEIANLRGRAAWLAGKPEVAERAWSDAIERVEALSAAEPEHQGWVVARQRSPYDALFAALAGRGDHARAWEVVSRFTSSESLSFTGTDEADPVRALASAEALKAQWSTTQRDRGQADSKATDSRDVLVLHEAEGDLWVGRRIADTPRWIKVGPLASFDANLHRFLGDPGDEAAATALGEQLWRAAGLTASSEPLFVAATGRLRGLALAALRVDGRYWFQQRPLARLPTLSPPRVRTVSFTGPPVVAGDPKGDLSAARDEAGWLAPRVGTRALTGAEATRAAILSARGSSLLHVATHTEVGLDGARLVLADGELSAREVLREEPHAAVVVLASCASAAGRDAAGSDSLTTAFLRAGSGAVLGTLRTVPDAATQQLIRAFYEEGGRSDPVGALSRAQARVLAYHPPSVWSAFVISAGQLIHEANSRR